MSDKTAADRLNELLDRAPKEADYMKSVTIGSGKRSVTKQVLDKSGFDAATSKFQSNYGTVIKNLQDQIGLETTRLGQNTTREGLAAKDAAQRADYLNSPTHAMFSDFAAVPPMAGTLGGYGLARLTTPKALPGASAASRALLMAGPLAEAALGPAVDAIAKRAQGDNPTERGKDVTGAVGNFGLGESAGAIAGGIYQAMGGMGRNVKGGTPVPSPVPSVPPPPPFEPMLDLKGKTPTEASREILTKLGITPASSLKENKALILKEIPKADASIQEAIAASHDAFEPGKGLGKSIVGRLTNPRRLAVPLGALAAGSAALGLGSGESEAGGLPAGGPSKDESMTQYRLRQIGLGSPAEAANTASYYAPGIGLARAVWDVGSTAGDIARRVIKRPEKSVMPRDSRFAGLEKAQAEDARQRAEMGPEREPIGEVASRATPENGGVADCRDIAKGPVTPGVHPDAFVPASEMGFDHTHLPEYERGLFERGIHPSEAAMHLMPHARAGAEAVRRGEDFWGGTDQYERERAALRGFYGAVNAAQGDKGNPDAGISDEDVTRALGGRVGASR